MKPLQISFFFFFFFTTCIYTAFGQTKNYDTEWKRIDELLNKRRLPQSALAEVKKIYTQAKREGQDAQVIKAMVYMTSLQQETRENAEAKAIAEIEAEIKGSKAPAAAILKSYLAGLYWNYFQNHRWQIYNRTATAGAAKGELETWTATDFHQKISDLYLQSLQHEKLLQQTTLKPYEALIIKGNVRHLRPTLFDLLAHRALDYFKSGESDLNKPAYAFELTSPEGFAPAAAFAKATFPTKDTFSLQRKALLLYQALIRFHLLPDPKPDALVDVDVSRIQFVHQISVADNKDSLYEQALQRIANQYGTTTGAYAWHLLALHYESLAGTYHPLQDTTHRYARLKAKEILERVVRDSAQKSAAWAVSYNLLQEINKPQFSFELEKVNVPQLPFRALVTYKQVPQLYFRLIKATDALSPERNNQYEDAYWDALLAARPVRSWQQALPPTNDLQQHRVEVKIDALPTGKYLLIASADAAFSKKGTLGAHPFYVSNISYINSNNQYFVLHRQSGQPLADAAVQVFRQQYDYQTSRYKRVPLGRHTADANGYFELKDSTKKYASNTLYFYVAYRGDSLNMDEGRYHYFGYGEPEKRKRKHPYLLFTDRSIYRPGQTVYFKGIAIKGKEKNNEIVRNWKTKIYLRNANYETADSMEVTTNDYGAFSGTFSLPQGGLNGNFSIHDLAQNEVSFSVEEYKRPKFLVQFDTLKTEFKLFDTVAVQGQAQAYAGNNISGAQVAYRVVRQPRFPYPWLFKGWWPRTPPVEIAHGVATTDSEGRFVIRFAAKPDLKIDKILNPVFDYRIYADVTDLTGETRSNNQVVSIGYQSLLLQVALPQSVSKDSLQSLTIRTENRAGAFQPAQVTVSFTQLVPEQRLIRERYWQQPDQFLMSKETYIGFFPHDEYSNERDYRNWAKGALALQKTDSTKSNGRFTLGQTLPAGFYEVVVTTRDKEGNPVKDIQYIELYDQAKQTLAQPQYLWAHNSNAVIEPGQKMQLQIGSAADNVFLIREVDKPGKTNRNFTFNRLQKEKQTFSLDATEADRGGYGVAFFFVKHNRVHQYNTVINVPWTNKELKIEYSTFRDKTLPGSEEKWTVKITGSKGEKVAAEMLAGMYDASLDQFRPHQWYKPGLWPVYANTLRWQGQSNFTSVTAFQRDWNPEFYRHAERRYDRFNFDVYGQGSFYGREMLSMKPTAGIAKQRNAANLEEMALDMSAPAPLQDTTVAASVDGMQANQENVPAGVDMQDVQVRTNFNETAFFFPHLQTDKDGSIQFSFTAPEALTRWKLQTLAHTQDLAMGLSTQEMVTQKELMVQPGMPRFLRQGDRIELSVKIANLSEKELTGQVQLLLIDATTGQSVDGWFQNVFPNQYFTVAAGGSEAVRFPIEVPYLFNQALTWRVVARSGNYSDGEEAIMPILTNKILVTETMPLPMQGSGTKNFTFEKLLNTQSETLQHHALTVEYTANPAWLAVQALPYLAQGENETADQTWNRYYANALAAMLVQKAPRIKAVFENWKGDSTSLLSNLQKNESLKALLLEETPWVLAAKSEAQQKQNLALLFDAVRMSNDLKSSLQKLGDMQQASGGFVWCPGGPEDRYMTQYIVTGIGHLQHLKGDEKENKTLNAIVQKALLYLDRKTKEDYDRLVKSKADLSKQQVGYLQVQYLYMRSFFPQRSVPAFAQTAYQYFRKQAQQYWQKQNKYMQGMTALALHRTGDTQTPRDIVRSLKETAITNDEMGMYWKDVSFGISPFWWQAPIETQSLLIEVFSEIGNDTKTVDALRTWLIKNKQTTQWRTSKATADACYALLLQGSDWISSEPQVQIRLGDKLVSNTTQQAVDGTGYFTQTIEGAFVQPQMGQITLQVQPSHSTTTQQPVNRPSWGAVYWQYFEDMDKVTRAATPLQIGKTLFIEKAGDRGPVLTPITEGSPLQVGDKVTVRIELRADRDMEYVHLKDLRASALEPTNTISGYSWQGGLGYYQTTKDAATHFFFNYLRKGTYVFEYSLFVTNAGNFSNGITSIQSMYAPEFSAHSEGTRINVEAGQ